MAAEKKNQAKGGAKKAGRTTQLWKLYEIQGDKIIRKNQFSPKSPGDFLANHKDRLVCGKTGYTEYKKKAQ